MFFLYQVLGGGDEKVMRPIGLVRAKNMKNLAKKLGGKIENMYKLRHLKRTMARSSADISIPIEKFTSQEVSYQSNMPVKIYRCKGLKFIYSEQGLYSISEVLPCTDRVLICAIDVLVEDIETEKDMPLWVIEKRKDVDRELKQLVVEVKKAHTPGPDPGMMKVFIKQEKEKIAIELVKNKDSLMRIKTLARCFPNLPILERAKFLQDRQKRREKHGN